MTDINVKNVQKFYNKLSSVVQGKLINDMIKYGSLLEDIANPKSGKISKVFGTG